MRKQWEQRIASYRASGLTQAKWCEANNLVLHQLKYWLKRIEDPALKSVSTLSFAPVVIENQTTRQDDILQVKVGDVSIEVKPGFNHSLLSDVVRTLKTLC
ncbi:IS66 family insertion sequence element accessory protein TnpA [Bacillota bacterium Lsc_1132]